MVAPSKGARSLVGSAPSSGAHRSGPARGGGRRRRAGHDRGHDAPGGDGQLPESRAGPAPRLAWDRSWPGRRGGGRARVASRRAAPAESPTVRPTFNVSAATATSATRAATRSVVRPHSRLTAMSVRSNRTSARAPRPARRRRLPPSRAASTRHAMAPSATSAPAANTAPNKWPAASPMATTTTTPTTRGIHRTSEGWRPIVSTMVTKAALATTAARVRSARKMGHGSCQRRFDVPSLRHGGRLGQSSPSRSPIVAPRVGSTCPCWIVDGSGEIQPCRHVAAWPRRDEWADLVQRVRRAANDVQAGLQTAVRGLIDLAQELPDAQLFVGDAVRLWTPRSKGCGASLSGSYPLEPVIRISSARVSRSLTCWRRGCPTRRSPAPSTAGARWCGRTIPAGMPSREDHGVPAVAYG